MNANIKYSSLEEQGNIMPDEDYDMLREELAAGGITDDNTALQAINSFEKAIVHVTMLNLMKDGDVEIVGMDGGHIRFRAVILPPEEEEGGDDGIPKNILEFPGRENLGLN